MGDALKKMQEGLRGKRRQRVIFPEACEHEAVIAATRLAQEKDPSLLVDGEMQLDAAVVPAVTQKKVGRESAVAGRANVLVVPDLNVGNILYKAIQRFAGADAYGPIMQGFRKPVSDLSRGSSADDIFGVIVVSCLMAAE